MPKKRMCVANFNTVFLTDKDEELPLLDCFDSIIMPALTAKTIKKSGDTSYFITDIKVEKDFDNDYIMTGIIVKDTVLEVKHNYNFKSGILEDKDERHQSSPYSLFIIFLKNHRMVYVEDQKGSPSLDNFRSTVKYTIDRYVANENKKRRMDNEPLLPIPLVNVIGISPKESIEEILSEVEKITSLKLRFYPLNGDDVDFTNVFGGLLSARRLIGSPGGRTVFNSPSKKKEVIKLIESAEGTMEPTLEVKYPGEKHTKTITMDSIIEKQTVQTKETDVKDDFEYIIRISKKNKSIIYTSKENEEIYNRNQNKIIPFVR